MEQFLIWSNPITWIIYSLLWITKSVVSLYKYLSNIIYVFTYSKSIHLKTDNDIFIAYVNVKNLKSRKWDRRKFKLSIIREYRKRTYKLIEG